MSKRLKRTVKKPAQKKQTPPPGGRSRYSVEDDRELAKSLMEIKRRHEENPRLQDDATMDIHGFLPGDEAARQMVEHLRQEREAAERSLKEERERLERSLKEKINEVAPLVAIGRKVKQASSARKKDKDREEFLRLARAVIANQPDVERAELLKHESLAEIVRLYPSKLCTRWAGELYPRRARGRPRKK